MSNVTADYESLAGAALAEIEGADALDSLDALRPALFGKKAPLTEAKKSLGALDPDDRKAAGQALNAARQRVEEAHLFVEAAGYVLGAVAANFLSRAFAKYAWTDPALWPLLRSVAQLTGAAALMVALAAWLEATLPAMVTGLFG